MTQASAPAAALILLLSACAPPDAAAPDACGAAPAQDLVGAPLAETRLAAGADVRILTPDSMATMDYRAERLNVHVDAGGTIVKLSCG